MDDDKPGTTTEQTTQEVLHGRLRTMEGATLKHAHRFIVRRWKNLREVRMHAFGWVVLILLLVVAAWWQSAKAFEQSSVEVPAENTTYTEGTFGMVDNLNPIFASTQAERSASRLLFANLLRYNEQGELEGELAQSWGFSGGDGRAFILTLRPDIRWHDGAPITAKDIAFTFALIKDAATKSPLYSSWRTISIEQVDARTVKFILPTAYAPFPNALAIGILPEHILSAVRPAELRNFKYNRSPNVASGPFVFQDMRALDTQRSHFLVSMSANKQYFLGTPKLSRFQLHAYTDRDQLTSAFRSQEVAAISDASATQIAAIGNERPFQESESPLYNGVYAFLKTSSPLLQDVKVRQALELATDQGKVVNTLGNRVTSLEGPLLPGQLGYRADMHQAPYNLVMAGQLLDAAGWKAGPDGKRAKDGQPLKFNLVTVAGDDFPAVAQTVMGQWSRLGVTFESQLIRPDDFQQNVIVPRAYDVLIYEIAIGRDPDVYAYWHSSQANERGFNLSDYRSGKADDALDSARSRLDPALREAKYRNFTQQWLADVPAIALYRPSLSYVQTKNTASFTAHRMIDQTDRYYNIRYWSAIKEPLRPTL